MLPARDMPGSSGAGAPAADSPAGAPEAAAQAAPRPQVVREPTGAELVAEAVARWRAALVERAGASPLTDVARLGDARLDLSAAHPSGVAQLFAGRPTRLSNLVREGAALSTARRRARSVSQRADDYAQRFGVAPTFLAIGVATWTERVRDEPEESDDVAALAAVTPVPDGASSAHGEPGAADEIPGDGAPSEDATEGADHDDAASTPPSDNAAATTATTATRGADRGPTTRTRRAPVL